LQTVRLFEQWFQVIARS